MNTDDFMNLYMNKKLEIITSDKHFNRLKTHKKLFTQTNIDCYEIELCDLVKMDNTIYLIFKTKDIVIYGKTMFKVVWNYESRKAIHAVSPCYIEKIKKLFDKIDKTVTSEGFDSINSFLYHHKKLLNEFPDKFI